MQQLLKIARRDRWLLITSVTHQQRNLVLRLELFPQPDDGSAPAWVVTCQQVRQFELMDFDGGGLNWWKVGHPLLSQFSSPKASLRIALGHHSRAECVGLLLQAHRRLVHDWIDFDRFVPPAVLTHDGADPFVVSGPEFLLEAYQRRLLGSGFAAKLKKHKRALYWSGFGWSEQRHAVSLLHMGNSFVVAESFAASPETGGST